MLNRKEHAYDLIKEKMEEYFTDNDLFSFVGYVEGVIKSTEEELAKEVPEDSK